MELKYDKIMYFDYDEEHSKKLGEAMGEGNIPAHLDVIIHNQAVILKRLQQVEAVVKFGLGDKIVDE